MQLRLHHYIYDHMQQETVQKLYSPHLNCHVAPLEFFKNSFYLKGIYNIEEILANNSYCREELQTQLQWEFIKRK